MKDLLPDIQNTPVSSIQIDRVGVTDIDFPLPIKLKNGIIQTIYSTAHLYGSLPKTRKGTNMSRYLEVLFQQKQPLNVRKNLRDFLYQLLQVVDTKDIYCEINFKLFMEKIAPVSKKKGVLAYNCSLIGRLQQGKYTFFNYAYKIKVPVTSVCPCSKQISKFGAHNQRGYVEATIIFEKNKSIPLEDLIKLIEKQGSCELYPILKRPDEKYVTEKGYKNAKFVEDICRDVAIKLQEISVIKKFKIKVENFESIHDHNAVAYVFRKRRGKRWTSDIQII